MAINKVYPELRCQVCGEVLETEEPETTYVFLLLVKPCKTCAAQQSFAPKEATPLTGSVEITAINGRIVGARVIPPRG